jgi:hypothetical protein
LSLLRGSAKQTSRSSQRHHAHAATEVFTGFPSTPLADAKRNPLGDAALDLNNAGKLNLPAVQRGHVSLSQALWPAGPPKEGERGAGEQVVTLKVGTELARGKRGEALKRGRSTSNHVSVMLQITT